MSLRIRNLAGCAAIVLLAAAGGRAATFVPLATFGGGDGYLAPGDRAYLPASPGDNNQRGLAYNPTTGHLLLVNRTVGLSVNVLDAATGTDLGTLNVTGVAGGTFIGNMIGVAEDGAIYMDNLTTNATTTAFTVYRWDNESSGADGRVHGAPLAGARIGDTFDVIGSGTSTRLAAGYGNAPVVTGNNSFALFQTTDGVNFTSSNIAIGTDPPAAGDFRLGITFADADTVLGKQASTASARVVDIDVLNSTGTLVQSTLTDGSTITPMDYATVAGKDLLALVNTGGGDNSHVWVYDQTGHPAISVDVAEMANPAVTNNANANGTGQVKFGPITGTKAIIYALDTNNGIQAWELDLAVAEDADFDDNTIVGDVDFDTWTAGYGIDTGATHAGGDANADGAVNGRDFLVWQRQFNELPLGVAAGGEVPEPGTVGLMALAGAAGARRKRRG